MPLRLAREESTREHKGTVNQYNAPALALTQESNNFNVHKSDFTQVHEYADVLIVHLSLYVADIGRLNSNTELQGGQATRPTVTEFRGLIRLSMHYERAPRFRRSKPGEAPPPLRCAVQGFAPLRRR
jgi:hypothetical protein